MASIKNDMEYYNSMKRYAFSLIVKQGGDGPVRSPEGLPFTTT